jgi:hypothetical protein
LIGLGFLLNDLLPPRPRCRIVFPSLAGFGFLSLDGSTLLTTPPVSFNNFLGGGMGSGSYQLWDARTGALRKTCLQGKNIGCYGLSPDLRYLAVSEGPKNPDPHDDNASSVLHLVDLSAQTHYQRPIKSIVNASRLRFSPRGTYVDVSGLNHNKQAFTRQLVQSATGALLKSFDKFSGLRGFSPDEKLVLFDIQESCETVVWDVSSSQSIGSFAGVEEGSLSPDGKTLVLWRSPGKMEFWDISEGKLQRRASDLLAESIAEISSVSLTFSPDSSFLAADYWRRIGGGAEADKVVVWDVPSSTRLWTRKADHFAPRFLPDSNGLVLSHAIVPGARPYEVMDARAGSLRHAISWIGGEVGPADEFTKNNRFLTRASTPDHLLGILEGF